MTLQAPVDLEIAFVRPTAPSFAALIERLGQEPDLSPERHRDLVSGLRRLAKALGRGVEDVPADPRWLRPRIARVAPAAVGLSAKSWTNVVSDARAAMAHAGIVVAQKRRREHLSPAWLPLWDAVLASRDLALRAAIGRLVHFVSRFGVAPEDVDDSHATAYREALERNEIAKDPVATWRAAVNGWNRAGARLPVWPRRRLTLPSRGRPIGIPLASLPGSFAADIHRYIGRLATPDPLDEDAPLRGMRPSSLKLRRVELIRFAGVLVRAGEPAESLIDLAALVEPMRVEHGLRWLLARNGQRPSPGIARIAETLAQVARRYARVDATAQAALDRLALRLAVPKQPGLTAKNRERLRQLDDPAALRRLLTLPERLMAAADAKGPDYQAHLLREDAVAVAVLLTCPVRVGNLARIDLERNLRRPGGGRAFLVFEGEEVKSGRRIEFELPKSTMDLIDRHLALRSPALCPRGTRWLFPKRDGLAPLAEGHLSRKVCASIRREAGLVMNVHLFRHVAAKLLLEAHPGSYDLVRRLLGHAANSTVIDSYAGFEAGVASQIFAKLVDARRAG